MECFHVLAVTSHDIQKELFVWLSVEVSLSYLPYHECLKICLVFFFHPQAISHQCTCASQGCFLGSLPLPTIFELHWSLLKKKKLAGGCKFALYLRHPGILNCQGSPSSAFSNSLKLHHVLFSASMMVSSSFLWSIRRKQLVSITAEGDIAYWILVY